MCMICQADILVDRAELYAHEAIRSLLLGNNPNNPNNSINNPNFPSSIVNSSPIPNNPNYPNSQSIGLHLQPQIFETSLDSLELWQAFTNTLNISSTPSESFSESHSLSSVDFKTRETHTQTQTQAHTHMILETKNIKNESFQREVGLDKLGREAERGEGPESSSVSPKLGRRMLSVELLQESEHKLINAKNLLSGHLDFATQLTSPSRATTRVHSTLIRLLSHLALIKLGVGKYTDAVTKCLECLELDHEHVGVHVILGHAYLKMKRLEDASMAFQQAEIYLTQNHFLSYCSLCIQLIS